jgi:hypothetical protein
VYGGLCQLLQVERGEALRKLLKRGCRVQLFEELFLHRLLEDGHQQRPEVVSHATKAETGNDVRKTALAWLDGPVFSGTVHSQSFQR